MLNKRQEIQQSILRLEELQSLHFRKQEQPLTTKNTFMYLIQLIIYGLFTKLVEEYPLVELITNYGMILHISSFMEEYLLMEKY